MQEYPWNFACNLGTQEICCKFLSWEWTVTRRNTRQPSCVLYLGSRKTNRTPNMACTILSIEFGLTNTGPRRYTLCDLPVWPDGTFSYLSDENSSVLGFSFELVVFTLSIILVSTISMLGAVVSGWLVCKLSLRFMLPLQQGHFHLFLSTSALH